MFISVFVLRLCSYFFQFKSHLGFLFSLRGWSFSWLEWMGFLLHYISSFTKKIEFLIFLGWSSLMIMMSLLNRCTKRIGLFAWRTWRKSAVYVAYRQLWYCLPNRSHSSLICFTFKFYSLSFLICFSSSGSVECIISWKPLNLSTAPCLARRISIDLSHSRPYCSWNCGRQNDDISAGFWN